MKKFSGNSKEISDNNANIHSNSNVNDNHKRAGLRSEGLGFGYSCMTFTARNPNQNQKCPKTKDSIDARRDFQRLQSRQIYLGHFFCENAMPP